VVNNFRNDKKKNLEIQYFESNDETAMTAICIFQISSHAFAQSQPWVMILLSSCPTYLGITGVTYTSSPCDNFLEVKDEVLNHLLSISFLFFLLNMDNKLPQKPLFEYLFSDSHAIKIS
jgi:hypothetical protein